MKTYYLFLFIFCSLLFISCTEDGALSESEDSFTEDGLASSEPGGESSGVGDGSQDNSGIVTAGEWNDLANWSFWQNLLNQEEADAFTSDRQFNTANRFSFKVTDASNLPAVDIPISVKQGNNIVWEARTDNQGTAELWIDLKNNTQKTADASTYSFTLTILL